MWRSLSRAPIGHLRSGASYIKIGSHHLEYCHQYKYLGYWINEFLDINESIQKVFHKANLALSVLMAKSKATGGFPLFCIF